MGQPSHPLLQRAGSNQTTHHILGTRTKRYGAFVPLWAQLTKALIRLRLRRRARRRLRAYQIAPMLRRTPLMTRGYEIFSWHRLRWYEALDAWEEATPEGRGRFLAKISSHSRRGSITLDTAQYEFTNLRPIIR